MDFLSSLTKNFKQVYLKGGQTECSVKVSEEDYESTELEPRALQGRGYVDEYLLKDRLEAVKLCSEENHTLPSESEMSSVEMTSLGVISNTDSLKQETTHFYSEYFKYDAKPDNDLSINDYKSKILSMIELNEVIIIAGPTGCGKTTQVPQFILDTYVRKNVHCNIVVTQPRRIAAISVSRRVCEERGWPLGTICGYKVGLKDCTSEDTRLTYCTVGVLLQILINKKNMNDYTHVILDEVHERDQSLDFCLLIVRKLLSTNSRNVKVILMSATAEVGKLASYFEKRISGNLQPAPVISIMRPTNFVVQIYYLDDLAPLGELPELDFDEPSVSEPMMMACIKLIKQFERLDTERDEKKSVLVFLPGIYEIEEMFNRFKDPRIYNPGKVEYKWFPIPLHSSITAEEQALAFRAPPSGFRKIILATNIAESSITVPDVMFVVDLCLTKLLMTDLSSNFTSLQLCWSSKANCIQRAGRAGRVMDGRVYRMVYRDLYQSFSEQCTPEMLRCSLEKVVLQAKLLGIGNPKAVLALAIDPPDLTNIERTVLVLKEAGGLLQTDRNVRSPHDGDLTYLGRMMALMPVDIHITRLMVLGHLFSCLEQCIIMGAAMSSKSVFSSPFQARLKSYNSKLEWADGSCSDCIAFLNVYEVWTMNHSNGYFKRSAGYGEQGWARRHFIQLRALKEVKILVEELTRRLKSHNIEKSVGVGSVQWNDVHKSFLLKFVIAGAFYPNYFGRGARGGQVSEKMAVRTLGGRDPFTTVYLQNYPLEQPRELYSHLIKEKLVECKEDMKITYDNSSKVYIEFRKQDYGVDKADLPFNSEVPGKISMGVYRAVKFRQILKHVEIKVLPSEQAKRMADQLGLEKKTDFLSRHLEDVVPKEKLFQSMLPGIDVSLIPIRITHVVSPSHFWVSSKDTINERHEGELCRTLNDPNAQLEPYAKPPPVGEMCVAPYTEEESTLLYRARVDGYPKENRSVAQVFFIDYGNTSLVPVKNLLRYKESLLTRLGRIPALCFECCLAKVKPSVMRNSSGKWCEEAKKEFLRMTDGADLIGSVYSVVGSIVSMELFKMTYLGQNSRQVNVNQALVRQGFAEEVEESYLSKANHELRSERQLDSEQKEAYNSIQMEDTWMDNSFHPPDLQDCKYSLNLRGPYSPLEMKIFSCTHSGLPKHVTISSSSVNSVLLDSDPQDPHERLVVAAQISQNQSGGNLILHHTTVMPNIHGLAALIPFVFAPTAELRINDKHSHYTGVLCGLGVDKHRRPMFPEHDMEIVFDCEFTFDDFTAVNKLRFFMSLLLLSEDRHLHHSGADVIAFQNSIKETLLQLIDRHRPSKDLEFPRKEYKWNLVDSDLVSPNQPAGLYSQISIFPIHPGVSIFPRPNEKKTLLLHIDTLRSLAAANLHLDAPTGCELCSVPLPTINDVKLHLKTDSHNSKEEKLKSSLEDH